MHDRNLRHCKILRHNVHKPLQFIDAHFALVDFVHLTANYLSPRSPCDVRQQRKPKVSCHGSLWPANKAPSMHLDARLRHTVSL